jgi:hypothetical protein
MQNPLLALIRKARAIRRERHAEAELDLALEDRGYRHLTRTTAQNEDFERDDHDWHPSDEDGPLW